MVVATKSNEMVLVPAVFSDGLSKNVRANVSIQPNWETRTGVIAILPLTKPCLLTVSKEETGEFKVSLLHRVKSNGENNNFPYTTLLEEIRQIDLSSTDVFFTQLEELYKQYQYKINGLKVTCETFDKVVYAINEDMLFGGFTAMKKYFFAEGNVNKKDILWQMSRKFAAVLTDEAISAFKEGESKIHPEVLEALKKVRFNRDNRGNLYIQAAYLFYVMAPALEAAGYLKTKLTDTYLAKISGYEVKPFEELLNHVKEANLEELPLRNVFLKISRGDAVMVDWDYFRTRDRELQRSKNELERILKTINKLEQKMQPEEILAKVKDICNRQLDILNKEFED